MSTKGIVRIAVVLLFAAALIAAAAIAVTRYNRGKAANVNHDTLEAAGNAFDAALFLPVMAGELFACKSLLSLLAGEKRSRERNALNAVILAFSVIMAALPMLSLTGHYLIPVAPNRLGSIMLMLQLALPFALILVNLIITAIDVKKGLTE